MAFLRELTEEETLLIPSYRQFWYETALSTAKLKHKQVQADIQRLYAILGLKTPKIHFCNNLYTLVRKSRHFLQQPGFCQDGSVFATPVMAQIHDLQTSFFESIGHWDFVLTSQLSMIDGQDIECNISRHLQQILLNDLPDCFQDYQLQIYLVFPRTWYAGEASQLDFHFSVAQRTLYKKHDDLTWQVYRQLIQSCSWFTAFENDCLVCERPIAFSFKHGNTLPLSILFSDGEKLVITA